MSTAHSLATSPGSSKVWGMKCGNWHLSGSTGNQGFIECLRSKKKVLADLDTEAQCTLVRSRFQNINDMDTASSFFLSLECAEEVHTLLLSDTRQNLTEPGQIRAWAAEFYSLLLRSEYKETDDQNEEFCSRLPQVPEDINSSLECTLTLQELHAALQIMLNQKAHGIDGLCVRTLQGLLRHPDS